MIIANFIGFFASLFLIWRTLKEDYAYEKIFNLASLSLIGLLISLIISKYVAESYWFWIAFLGSFSFFLAGVIHQKMKFFECFESYVIGFMPWLGLYFLSDAVEKLSLSSFLAFWATMVCVFVYFFSSSHYRSLTWYKTGKVGFAGVVTALLFVLLRIITSIFFPSLISISGKYEIYISGSTALLLLILMYNLFKQKE